VFNKPIYKRIEPLLGELVKISKRYWGGDLLSLVIFGSYAKGEISTSSDLDLLVLVKKSPLPFRSRSMEFMDFLEREIELPFRLNFSPFVLTEEEARRFHPLLLDIERDHLILYDEGFFERLLRAIKEMYRKGVVEEMRRGGKVYWRIDYEKIGEGLPLQGS